MLYSASIILFFQIEKLYDLITGTGRDTREKKRFAVGPVVEDEGDLEAGLAPDIFPFPL